MTQSITYIVDREATLAEAPAIADRVVAALLSRGLILPTPKVDPDLGQGAQYATGPNADRVATYNECFACGLDVVIERQVYMSGELGLDQLSCPLCKHAHSPNLIDWSSAVGGWFNKHGPEELLCSNCQRASNIANWDFQPAWGFGNLAFVFREWFLEDFFVKELESLIGHKIAWVNSQW